MQSINNMIRTIDNRSRELESQVAMCGVNDYDKIVKNEIDS